jgi:hypothetical protein
MVRCKARALDHDLKENRVSGFGLPEKLPVGALFTPGVTGGPRQAAAKRLFCRIWSLV